MDKQERKGNSLNTLLELIHSPICIGIYIALSVFIPIIGGIWIMLGSYFQERLSYTARATLASLYTVVHLVLCSIVGSFIKSGY